MPNIFSTKPWWRGIAPGDLVHYKTPQGNTCSGRVVMSLPTHVVLNAGGKYGRPKVVDERNYLKHRAKTLKHRLVPSPKPEQPK